MKIVNAGELRRLPRNDAGFTFNELLVTMGVVTIVVMSFSLSSGQLFRQQRVAGHSTVAVHLAQDKMEQLQGLRPLHEIDNCPGGGDHGLLAAGDGAVFSRCWKIRPSGVATDLKRIDVIVSWHDDQPHEIALSTLIYTGD